MLYLQSSEGVIIMILIIYNNAIIELIIPIMEKINYNNVLNALIYNANSSRVIKF